MPETAVDEDDSPVPGQNHIRRSGQITTMKPEPVSHAMQQ